MIDFWLVDLFTFFSEWSWYSWLLLPFVILGILFVIIDLLK